MPIRPEFRHLYRGTKYRAFRETIRKRAGDRCEYCRKPNHATIYTITGHGKMHWVAAGGKVWRDRHGRRKIAYRVKGLPRKIKVICGVCHLNHKPGDDRMRNVRFLCQWCHLDHDKTKHKDTRAERKDSRRPLLVGAIKL